MSRDLQIRDMVSGDYNFIIDSWLNQFKNSSEFARRIKHAIYFEKQAKVIEKLIARSKVRVASLCSDPSVIVGYLVFELPPEKPIAHFVYVKPSFRRMGIARELVQGLNIETCTFTHWTFVMDYIHGCVRKDKDTGIKGLVTGAYPNMVYDPFLAR